MTVLIEKTEELLRLLRERMRIVWHEAASNIPGHRQYFDDERGPDESRYNVVPMKTKAGRFSRYCVDENGRPIGGAKTADEAKALAQEHVANNPPDRE